MSYELYSETLGDWPLVGYYALAWLSFYPLIEKIMPLCPSKLKLKDDSQPPATLEDLRTAWEQSKENLKETMAMLNALYCVLVGGYVLLQTPWVWDNESYITEQYVVNFSLAYFVADTVYGLYLGILPADKIMHHVGVVIGLGVSTTMGMFSKECLVSCVIGEASNLFLCGRNLMEGYGLKKGRFYVSIGVVFMVSFVFCRVFTTIWLMPHLQSDPKKPIFLNIASVIMFWVSWLWIWRIANLGSKFFAEANQKSAIAQKIYQTVKACRKYEMVYHVFVTWLTTRHVISARFGIEYI